MTRSALQCNEMDLRIAYLTMRDAIQDTGWPEGEAAILVYFAARDAVVDKQVALLNKTLQDGSYYSLTSTELVEWEAWKVRYQGMIMDFEFKIFT